MGLKAAKQYRNSKAIKINIACGPNPKPGWLNLDIEGADLTLDMRESIPLPDKCAQMIYSEHFFEHLDYPGDAMRFLRECRRLLACSHPVRFSVSEFPIPNGLYGTT